MSQQIDVTVAALKIALVIMELRCSASESRNALLTAELDSTKRELAELKASLELKANQKVMKEVAKREEAEGTPTRTTPTRNGPSTSEAMMTWSSVSTTLASPPSSLVTTSTSESQQPLPGPVSTPRVSSATASSQLEPTSPIVIDLVDDSDAETISLPSSPLQPEKSGNGAPGSSGPPGGASDSEEEGNERPWSFYQKAELSGKMRKLRRPNVEGLVNIVCSSEPVHRHHTNLELLKLDIDTLKPSTLRKMDEYVTSCHTRKRPYKPRSTHGNAMTSAQAAQERRREQLENAVEKRLEQVRACIYDLKKKKESNGNGE